MRIGELARRGGVTIRTIRFYVEQGLLPVPPRRGKYGEFDDSYLKRLKLILHLKERGLPISAIRKRLAEMGLATAAAPTPNAPYLSAGSAEGEELTLAEGLFRSRFADEAGLRPDQVAQLEAMGLLESREGLLPPDDLPLARAAANLLASGARMEDIAEITAQVKQESAIHQRLLDDAGAADALSRALRWQEQIASVSTIRQMLLRRWGYSDREQT